MNERAILAVLVCLPLLSGRACGHPEADRDGKVEQGNESFVVTGEVHYKERILLPPGASLRIAAEDSRSHDERAIAESSAAISGSPPHAFTLTIDESVVDEPKHVILRAEILVDGSRLFMSMEPTPAFDGGRPREGVEIVVEVAPPSD
jgi:putative lipoprotein